MRSVNIWETIKSWFGVDARVPPDARRLNATDESNLSASIKTLGDRELGWITLSETRSLFSEFDDDTAFGEMDPAGRSSLETFAARAEHRSDLDFWPTEGRLYLTRQRRDPR